jgi:DNA helicase-2/ATP-dependent DNA helicase PcrA
MDLFSVSDRALNKVKFDKAYTRLNPRQREAVESIEGPVMVIAGPGTGKTQILSVRIGNILRKTDTDPRSILCLTYTDSGAMNMRQRLLEFIGSDAYSVGIFTFHSFCNKIIKDHPDEFRIRDGQEKVSDLEYAELLEEIFDELSPEDILYHSQQFNQNNIYRLKQFHELRKKENWDPNDIIALLDEEEKNAPDDPQFQYQINRKPFKIGDLNVNKLNKARASWERTRSFCRLSLRIDEKMAERSLYDYYDMIRWVLDKFKKDDAFLASYQEQFLYILVDEYQDTNGSQNDLLYSLLSFDQQPNIFVVGDDDQAIFRFQGAKMDNMLEFKDKFHPKLIVLEDNYRSTQAVLDAAKLLITPNRKRLINQIPHLSKNLKSRGEGLAGGPRVNLTSYSSPDIEMVEVVDRIERLIEAGTTPSEIAVLFRKNIGAEKYASYMQSREIPCSVSKELNVLKTSLIKHIQLVLKFILEERRNPLQNDDLLYEMMHFPYFNINQYSISKLAWHHQSFRISLQGSENKSPSDLQSMLVTDSTLKESLSTESISEFVSFVQIMQELVKSSFDLTLQMLIEKIFHSCHILSHTIKSEDKYLRLDIMQSYFEMVKNESAKNPDLDLVAFLQMVELMVQHNITLPLQLVIGNRTGVQLFTVHKSKGLEYEQVFIPDVVTSSWDKGPDKKFKLPSAWSSQQSASVKESTEDEKSEVREENRRLFYVGMTRAKKELYISYHQDHESKSKSQMSELLVDLDASDHLNRSNVDQTTEFKLGQLVISKLSEDLKKIDLSDEVKYNSFLENFRLSPTSFNSYIRCPVSFYYEKVLKIPAARTAVLGYGNAVHYALEIYGKKYFKEGVLDEDQLHSFFVIGMEKYRSHFSPKEWDHYLDEGKRTLFPFVAYYIEEWSQQEERFFEKPISAAYYQGVPVSGKLDRIDILGDKCQVVDYKTGNSSKVKEKTSPIKNNLPHGGEYWRQMIFYGLLLDQFKEFSGKYLSSAFYFVNKNKEDEFVKAEIMLTSSEKEIVGAMVVDVYEKIKNKVFNPGCGKPECRWCQYIDLGDAKIIDENDSELDETFDED